MTFSLFGEPNLEGIEDSLNNVNEEMAESIVKRLEAFTAEKDGLLVWETGTLRQNRYEVWAVTTKLSQ